ncbi:MAG TPA: DUF3857 domain-containing protein [Steroidobacteraceae bacterium]|jgi:hypothetical protein|nr:DUF3857 domain-containing protein [Steroidobacteraceae bacterium]
MRPTTVNTLRIISLVLVLYVCGAGAAAPAWHVAARAAWVQESPVPPGVLPFHDRQIHITAAGDDRYEHLTLRLTPAQSGEQATQLSVSVDPRYQLLMIHSVRLTHRGAALVALTAAQIGARLHSQAAEPNPQQRALDPRLLISLALPDAKPGDLLECDYTVQSRAARFAGLMAGHYAAQWSRDDAAAMQWERLRVTWPLARTMRFKLSGGGAPRITSQAGELEVLWRDPPHAVTEADTPRWFETRSTVQLSDFSDWSEVATLLAAQYGEPAAPAPLPAAAPQAPPMILNALRLVQSKVHAIHAGAGPYLPADPAQVLQRGYGDSRELARVLAGLLRDVGIDARVALGDSHRGALLESRLPSPFILDSALVVAHNGATEYWLDPAAPGPATQLSTTDTTDLRHALLLAPSGSRLITLPPPANDSRLRAVAEQFDLSAGNRHPAPLTLRTQFHGNWAQAVRAELLTQSPAQRQLNQIQSVAPDYPLASSAGAVEVEDLAGGETLQLTARFRIPRPLGDGPDPHFDFFAEALTDAVAPRDEALRQLPLSIPWPLKLEQHITAVLPPNFTAPVGMLRVETAAYRYQREVRLTHGTLYIIHSYVTLSDHVQPADYPKFLAANARVYQALGLRAQSVGFAGHRRLDWLGEYALAILLIVVVAGTVTIGAWRRVRRNR